MRKKVKFYKRNIRKALGLMVYRNLLQTDPNSDSKHTVNYKKYKLPSCASELGSHAGTGNTFSRSYKKMLDLCKMT